MISKKNKIFALFVVLQIFVSVLFAQDAVTKALDLLNKSMILNDTEKSYSYARFVINYYEGEELPLDAETAVKKAVLARVKELEEKEFWDALLAVEEDLMSAQKSIKKTAQPSIQKAHDYYDRLEEEKLAKKEEEKRLMEELKRKEAQQQAKAEKDADTEKLLKIFEQQEAMEKSRQEAELAYRSELSQIMKEMNQNNNSAIKKVSSNNLFVMLGFGFLILIFIGLIIFVVFVMIRAQQKNQEQMQNTILTMQAMRIAGPVTEALPPGLQMQGRTMMLENNSPLQQETASVIAGNSSDVEDVEIAETVETDIARASASMDNESSINISGLLQICKQYGSQVDGCTNRKNVSARVADLVYKISRAMGYSEAESTVFYSAALVYDIGFLNIDRSVLLAQNLTEEQFATVKTHTTIGPNMVFFVEEPVREVFKDAAGKHHENLDGTGYPAGLKGDQIPYIARVLRVVESYIALVSRRQYKEISDRDEAIAELKSLNKKYDESIVNILDTIV